MTVKDVFEVLGMPATSGDPQLRDYIPKQNAIAVQRLLDAGAIVFGKTNVPFHAGDFQTFNDIYGTTNNPWDLSRTPGGSSGGSAAALAAGFTPLEIGSDIGGSVRFPAHYTGVFGHKTTFGLIPRYGHIPPMPGQVTVDLMPSIPLFVLGPLAHSADDLELALRVLTESGDAHKDLSKPKHLKPRKQKFSKYRVAVWFRDSDLLAESDTEVLEVLETTVVKLREAGLDLDEARPDIDLMADRQIWNTIYYQMKNLPLDPMLIERQKNHQAKWAKFFTTYDVLLTPVAPTVCFPHDQKGGIFSRSLTINGRKMGMMANMAWTYMAIVSGLPATVASVGLSESGLPVGIQIIGAEYEDYTTIDFAQGLSDLIGGFQAPPGFVEK